MTEVCLGEDNFGASGTGRADLAGLWAIWPLTAMLEVANGRPWRQSWPKEPVIWGMSVKILLGCAEFRQRSYETKYGSRSMKRQHRLPKMTQDSWREREGSADHQTPIPAG